MVNATRSGLVVLFALCAAALADSPPAMQPPRVMPDLTQTAKDAKLPGEGKTYCGPVAASNALVWLACERFPQLTPTEAGPRDPRNAQIEIAKVLGSRPFMNTSLEGGTGVNGVVQGLTRYVAERGFEHTFTHQGWRKPPQGYASDGERIEPQWLRAQLKPNSIVLLNIGWYERTPGSTGDGDGTAAEYNRYSGHWITLIGYGVDADGKSDADVLILHDSAPRAGPEGKPTYARLKPMQGKLTGSTRGLPRRAEGTWHLEGMHRPSRAAAAIVDAVVCVEIKPKQAE